MTRKKIKTLLLAAYPKELKAFADLGKSYQKIVDDKAYLAAGIGPVAATFGLTHFLEDYAPEQIVAIGTAGCVTDCGLQVQDLVTVKSVSLVGRGVAQYDLAVYVPELQVSTIAIAEPVQQNLQNLPRVKVFAPQEISQGQAWAGVLQNQGFAAEHLESFAYAFVAQKFKIPLTIVLGITNHIGPNAQQDWLQNEVTVMQKIHDYLCAV